MKVSLLEAKKLAKKLGIDLEKVPLLIWRYSLEVETEHLSSVDCDMLQVGKVARDHFLEYGPLYYIELQKMEEKLERHFKGKRKPRVLLSGTKLPPKCK
ncbi:hypothetical protein MAR_ORF021 [Marseillevirus marseillevirus]|uniref:Uncharacterized protein n=1 Tax=Marseillevirus marseillevirus TaxID=694581 RepID=D2XA37_GBMV|nr:hypothetical protein MAR_ORF021 [Marseillevirus marseillevirus]ADB03814.1 hypothetical protein MAR_ORF021 [Marseillevirus marseillevirus]AVR52726.1 hypothetical protein MarSH_021 [Marseillevirus Shanghai 1]